MRKTFWKCLTSLDWFWWGGGESRCWGYSWLKWHSIIFASQNICIPTNWWRKEVFVGFHLCVCAEEVEISGIFNKKAFSLHCYGWDWLSQENIHVNYIPSNTIFLRKWKWAFANSYRVEIQSHRKSPAFVIWILLGILAVISKYYWLNSEYVFVLGDYLLFALFSEVWIIHPNFKKVFWGKWEFLRRFLRISQIKGNE